MRIFRTRVIVTSLRILCAFEHKGCYLSVQLRPFCLPQLVELVSSLPQLINVSFESSLYSSLLSHSSFINNFKRYVIIHKYTFVGHKRSVRQNRNYIYINKFNNYTIIINYKQNCEELDSEKKSLNCLRKTWNSEEILNCDNIAIEFCFLLRITSLYHAILKKIRTSKCYLYVFILWQK